MVSPLPKQIPVYQQPACNDPARSLQITKRVFEWPKYRLQIVDNGEQILALLQSPDQEKGPANVTTDSITTAVVRGARLSIMPFIVPERLLETPQTQRAVSSYAKCSTALMEATLCINHTPFPTTMGTFIGVEMEDSRSGISPTPGLRIFGPRFSVRDYYPQKQTPKTEEEWRKAEANARGVGQSAEVLEKAAETNNTPVEIFLPLASQFQVTLDMGYGTWEGRDSAVLKQGAHVWEGTLTLSVEKNTQLG